MKSQGTWCLAAFLFLLSTTAALFGASCPGSVVTVDLTSPSGSGTYSIPLYMAATASSSAGTISGYAVYTNQWSDIPFASGQPMYLNGIATLHAYVMLPETQSGGALSQSVFVRVWDSAGNCGDSATLDITASGANIPSNFSPLGGVQKWTNVENDTENSNSGNGAGWWDCTGTTCAGGANGGTANFYFDQTSPELGSNPSIEFKLSGPAGVNGLYWYKVPPIGQQNSLQNFVWDFYFYLSSSDTTANTNALEFDLFQAVNGYKYMIGTQCNYHPSGVSHPIWNAWDATTSTWVPAVRNTETESNPSPTNAIACGPYTTGTWHHLQYYLQRTLPDSTYPQGRILYGTVSIDGSATEWDISAPAVSSSWGNVLGFQHQLDEYSGVTLQEWADEDDLTSWPQD